MKNKETESKERDMEREIDREREKMERLKHRTHLVERRNPSMVCGPLEVADPNV